MLYCTSTSFVVSASLFTDVNNITSKCQPQPPGPFSVPTRKERF